MKIKLDNIIPDPNQPRKTFNPDTIGELKDSLGGLGLIQPITVRPDGDGKYMIVVGERRYRAARQTGVTEIDCILREDVDDKVAREMQFTENTQQEDIPPLELGKAFYEHRQRHSLSQEQLGRIVGFSGGHIARLESLYISLTSANVSLLSSGEIDARTAQEIARIDDTNKQNAVGQAIAKYGLGFKATTTVVQASQIAPERPIESIIAQVQYSIATEKANHRNLLNEYKRQQVEPQPTPEGKYKTIVIDPPWSTEKILREVRPNQFDIDYPTMTMDEIKALPIPAIADEDGCHIYLWTTHKYLPTAFDILGVWGANYECLLTWIKNVGMTPFSWMYSTEHCLFARIGNLPLLKLGKRLDFQAKVREHSRKPDEFYNLVKEVSPEPRMDMFSREKREGFAQYGNEPGKFQD